MKPKKTIVERIATIMPIATRNTPFTISLTMPQRMLDTQRVVRMIKAHIASPMYCATCLKSAVAVIFLLFLIFLFLMRIQELRELSFKLSYLPLVYPTFFLMRLSVASVVFVSGAQKGRDSGMQGFSGKILPKGLEIFPENKRLDLAFPSNPGVTFAPRTKMTT